MDYSEYYLPLRFFLASIIVHCPSCNAKAIITTDIPPVSKQLKIKEIFQDSDTFDCEYLYRWKNACFLCYSCQKYFKTDSSHMMDTWQGQVECIAEAICPTCEKIGYKQRLFASRIYPSKNNLQNAFEIICPKCKTSVLKKGVFYPVQSASSPVDPIFGLKLFGLTSFKSKLLWAYNAEHLQHIQNYIKATQRKKNFTITYAHYNSSIESRSVVLSFSEQLPRLFKSESNRIAVLNELKKLYLRLIS